MPRLLRGMRVTKVDFVDRPADPHARIAIWKRDDSAPADSAGTDNDHEEGAMPETPTLTDEVRKGLPDEARAYVEALEAAKAADADDEGATPDEPTAADVTKRDDLPPEIVEAIAKRDEQIEALTKSADEATKIAKAERDRRVEREWGDRLAKFDGTGLPEDAPAKFRRLAEVDEDLAEAMVKALNALHEQVDTSALFKGAGFDGSGGPAGDAEKALDAKAEEIAKRDNIDVVEAFAKATEENPDLYDRYAAEKGA